SRLSVAMSYEDRRGVCDQSKLRRVLLQKFLGAFAINAEGELPGNGQPESELVVAEHVRRVEQYHELADELFRRNERDERERADSLLFYDDFKRFVYFSHINIVNANRLRIFCVGLPW